MSSSDSFSHSANHAAPLAEAAALHAADPLLGRVIGGYVLLDKLGEGGMGTVYTAEHQRSGHLAAVKVIHPEVATQPELAQRLRVEARAANRVPAPGVVRVLDCAHQGAMPFLVMELLTGDSLRTHCKRSAGGLPVAEALTILSQLAQTMAAAHDAGVVHRDLKPANVFLLTEQGTLQVKIIDFGLAKIRSAAGEAADFSEPSLTRDGALLGTAKYMAPELAMDPGAADGQVDVYALGAMAYELLAGSPPFSADTAWELVAMHLRDPPPSLQTCRPELPAPVVELVAHMLAKSPLLRPSMAEVRDRLAALLPDRLPAAHCPAPAVLAALPLPEPPLGKSRRWLWRILPPILAAVLLAGIALGLRKQRQVERQKSASLEVAQQLVRLIDNRLQSIPGGAGTAREMFDVTFSLLEQLRQESPADAAVLHSVIRTRTLRGRFLRNHGKLADANADLTAAVELGQALWRKYPDQAAYRVSLASAYDWLGDTQEQLTNLAMAQKSYLQALSLRQALLQAAPLDSERRQELVMSHRHLGDLEESLGHSAESGAHLEAARVALEPLWKAAPDDVESRVLLVGIYYRLAQLLPTLGRTAEAMALALQARQLQAQQLELDPKRAIARQVMAQVLRVLADTRLRSGELEGAEQAAAEALALHRSLLTIDGGDLQYRRDIVGSLHKIGEIQLQRGQLDAAERALREARQLTEALLQSDPAHRGYRWRQARNYQAMAELARARGQHDAARAAYQRALELQEALSLSDPGNAQQRRRLATLLEKFGEQLLKSGDLLSAQARLQQALQLSRELSQSDPTRSDYRQSIALVQRHLAAVLRLKDRPQEAQTLLRESLAAQSALTQSDPADALLRKELLLTQVSLSQLLALADAAQAAALRTQAASGLQELDRRHALRGDSQLSAVREALQSGAAATPIR